MGHYSDPTASMALGQINREFSRLEKKAKRLCSLYRSGQISADALKRAQAEYTGIYSHVLTRILSEKEEDPAE